MLIVTLSDNWLNKVIPEKLLDVPQMRSQSNAEFRVLVVERFNIQNMTRFNDQTREIYRSRYIICVAEAAPHIAKMLATYTTAAVEPERLTIVPRQQESKNCARNTIEETMATSVPNPRIKPSEMTSSVVVSANVEEA